MTAGRPAVRTCRLTKRYGAVTAVEDIELSVAEGEIYGFLGLNGAGKTTTIRLLLGMLTPTAGHAEIFGTRVGRSTTTLWRRVGHLVESPTAYPELTVRENLEIARRLHGVTRRETVADAIDRLGIAPCADRRARTLSSGNLQRLALARALLHQPDLLVLDEPTVGLDPAGVVEVRALLRSLARDRGATVFMSSHILTEVERIATRIGIVHGGRLVAQFTAAELDARRRRRLEVGARDLDAARSALRKAGFDTVRRDDVLEVADHRAVDRPDHVARLLVAAGAPPTRLAIAQDDMESFFLALTTQDAPPPAPPRGRRPAAWP